MRINKRQDRAALVKKKHDVIQQYLTGATMAEVAEANGVSIATVSKYVKAQKKAWASATLDNYAAYFWKEEAKLNKIEDAAWKAWQLAMANAVETYWDEDGNEMTRFSAPPAAYLREVRGAIEARYKLLGLEARDIKRAMESLFQKAAEEVGEQRRVAMYLPEIQAIEQFEVSEDKLAED